MAGGGDFEAAADPSDGSEDRAAPVCRGEPGDLYRATTTGPLPPGGRSSGRGTREALAPLTPNTPVGVGGTAGDKGKGKGKGKGTARRAVTTAADEDEDVEDDEEMEMQHSSGGGGSSPSSPDALLVMSPFGSSANAIEIFEDDTVDDEALARRLQEAGSDSEGENDNGGSGAVCQCQC